MSGVLMWRLMLLNKPGKLSFKTKVDMIAGYCVDVQSWSCNMCRLPLFCQSYIVM